MQENFVRHSKVIVILLGIAILICIASIIVASVNKYLDRNTYLVVQFAPSNATLSIDQTDYILRNGSYAIKPGHYTGVIRAEGFTSKEISFDVKPHQTNTITDYLVHSEERLKYFEKNAADISTLRHIKNDKALTDFLNDYDRKISIYNLLPDEMSWNGSLAIDDSNNLYLLRIEDGRNNPNCTSTLCLSTKGVKQNNYYLQDYLSQKGYDINDYEVFYEYSQQ